MSSASRLVNSMPCRLGPSPSPCTAFLLPEPLTLEQQSFEDVWQRGFDLDRFAQPRSELDSFNHPSNHPTIQPSEQESLLLTLRLTYLQLSISKPGNNPETIGGHYDGKVQVIYQEPPQDVEGRPGPQRWSAKRRRSLVKGRLHSI